MMSSEELLLHWEEIYVEHFPMLCRLAERKFRVPLHDAEALVHDVLLRYVHMRHTITQVTSWLIATTCNESRNYLRSEHRLRPLEEYEELPVDPAASLETSIDLQDALDRLPEKQREALRLRYLEGCSAAEIAVQLKTTTRYAEKLLSQGLARARGNRT